MSRKFSLSALVAALVLIASSIWSGPVAAAPDVMIMGVGVGTGVGQQRALYQCPATFCNQGQAYPGNNLAWVCTITAGGVTWALVFNRANEHSGYIPTSQLTHGAQGQSCANVGTGGESGSDYTLYQCPYSYCNQGQVSQKDDVAQICFHVANGFYWYWSVNHTNGHEGFRPATNSGGYPQC